MSITWTNERRKLSDLIPWERNPRYIKTKDAERLADSLDSFGQIHAIAIGPGNEIYDGHQRSSVWAAADKFGADYEVDVRVSSRTLTEKEREKLTVYLHTGAVGSMDFDMFAGWEFEELKDWGFDADTLYEWNDNAANLALMLDANEEEPPEDAEPQIDKAEELREKWGVESGQMWRLGDHRIICGDCTDKAVVDRVMGGEKARMIWTDPPYGVKYGDKLEATNPMGYRVREIQNDNLTADDLEELIRNAYKVLSEHCMSGAALYAACPPGTLLPTAIAAFKGSGFVFHWGLVWVKDQLVLGRGDYHFRHENILYGWKHDGAHYWAGDRKQDSLFEVPRPKKSEEHPTMKPVELIERMLFNSSDKGDIIAEPFSGSGSTLIACERLGRKCRAVEISPAYVAVAIQRWVDVTGGEPVLL